MNKLAVYLFALANIIYTVAYYHWFAIITVVAWILIIIFIVEGKHNAKK